MLRKSFYKSVTIFVLVILFLVPTVPCWADGHHPAGPFVWLDGWLVTVTSWFSGAEAQTADSLEQAEGETVETPYSFEDSPVPGESATQNDDAGPAADPMG